MNQTVQQWGPIPVRLFLAILVVPGGNKLLNYGEQVEFFTGLGIPAAEILVPVVGTLQLIAAITIGVGIAGRIGALPIVPIMLVAMATAGIDPLNTTTLIATLLLLALGTGRYTIMTDRELLDVFRSQPGSSGSVAPSGDSGE